MPTRKIDELVWRALTNSAFRERLLKDQRQQVLVASRLTEMERQTVLAVKANMEAFAGALCQPAFAGT